MHLIPLPSRQISRFFSFIVAVGLLASPLQAQQPAPTPAASQPGKPGWKVIFSNDTTNIFNCVSPYNPPGKKDSRFNEAMIRASVAEAAVKGVDAQLLQPGHGWVPWWPSKILPLAQHEAWYEARYGVKPKLPPHQFLHEGGDIIGAFIDECHKHGNAALVSYRVNDNHHLEGIDGNPGPSKAHALSQFYADHPEYRIGPTTTKEDRVHNWLIPAARDYKVSLIVEMLEQYPALDGLELDFMRFPNYFPADTPNEKRVEVMRGVLKEIRAALDRTSPDGKRRWLGARVPILEKDWANIGFDPAAWNAEGVDFFNLSPSYRLTQQTSVAQARKRAPQAAIYLELTHTPQTWKFGGLGYDDHCFRRSTDEMLENTARIGYAEGADGMSLFNFVYYRAHGGLRNQRGPFDEPPFDVLSKVADPAALQSIPGYFFLEVVNELFLRGRKREYSMEALPAEGNGSGIVRIQIVTNEEAASDENLQPTGVERGDWAVQLNGTTLEPIGASKDRYPFPTRYTAGFGNTDQYLEFKLPAGALQNGPNAISVEAIDVREEGFRLKWIDIIQPVAGTSN